MSEAAEGEHEVVLMIRKEDKDGWMALFRLHTNEDISPILEAHKGSRWALRYLDDDVGDIEEQ